MKFLRENEIVSAIVRNYAKEDILEIKQIKDKGQVNDIYVLATSSSKYVVRIDPREATLDRFQKEAWCMGETQRLGVSGAQALDLGTTENHPYMLLSYLEGIDGDEVEKNKQTAIWATLGEYARKIHSVQVTGYGEKMVAAGTFDGSWEQFLGYNISCLDADDKLLALGIITQAQSKILSEIFSRLKNTKFAFGLTHHDLSLKNTRISQDGTVYLLDWGSAEVNIIPHMDIGEILHSSLEESSREFEVFLQNYKISKEKYEEIKPDIEKLRLLSCTDKLRWAIDRKPDLIGHKTTEFKNVLERICQRKTCGSTSSPS